LKGNFNCELLPVCHHCEPHSCCF